MSGRPAARVARPDEMPAVMALRRAVFCDEQGVPEDLERDAFDATAVHVVLVDGGAVVGTCRLVREGDAVRLGRMAVAPGRRGRGLGAAILEVAHDLACRDGVREVTLHAQLTARAFYARAGYVEEGPEFTEAGIAHVAMRRPLGLRR